ncbi:MAG TPA: EI24 domain-containing protein [Geminicoccaceae bacterium]|nr:EI24 domain-containing protein [Geminicoccaceae bacterium]
MLKALILSLRQLSDPAIRRVLARCLLLAVLTFALLIGAVGWGLGALDPTSLAWLNETLPWVGSLVAVVLAWFLFPLAIAATLGLFADEVIEAVERRHYPELPPAPGMSLVQSTFGAVRFALVAIALNLLALPLYLLPGANLIVYVALNGYLLGREYFEQVAQRRLAWRSVATLRRAARGRLWWAGVWIAALLTVPVLNLIAPVLATCFMVHVFEGLRRGRAAERLRLAGAG